MSHTESGAAIAPRRRRTGSLKSKAPARRRRSGEAVGTRVGPAKSRKGTSRSRTGTARRGRDTNLRPQIESASSMALVLGLVGFLVLPLLGPFAIMKGNEANRLARRARLPVPGTATAGLVLGWLATVGLILGLLFLLAVVVLLVVAGAA